MKKWMTAGLSLLMCGAAMAEEAGATQAMEQESMSTMGIVIILIVALVVSLIVVSVLKGQLKIAKRAYGADKYIRKDSFELTASHDFFLYETVTRRKIETQPKKD